jgi:hypothetical protein
MPRRSYVSTDVFLNLWPIDQRIHGMKRKVMGRWYVCRNKTLIVLCMCGRVQPGYGNGTKLFCTKCRPANVVLKKCECGTSCPSFGLPSDRVARYCSWCRPSDAIDVMQKRCVCGRAQPSFGVATDRRPMYCAHCPTKPADALYMKSKRRCVCGATVPHYAPSIDDPRPLYCYSCKPAGAIRLDSLRCVKNQQRRSSAPAIVLPTPPAIVLRTPPAIVLRTPPAFVLPTPPSMCPPSFLRNDGDTCFQTIGEHALFGSTNDFSFE